MGTQFCKFHRSPRQRPRGTITEPLVGPSRKRSVPDVSHASPLSAVEPRGIAVAVAGAAADAPAPISRAPSPALQLSPPSPVVRPPSVLSLPEPEESTRAPVAAAGSTVVHPTPVSPPPSLPPPSAPSPSDISRVAVPDDPQTDQHFLQLWAYATKEGDWDLSTFDAVKSLIHFTKTFRAQLSAKGVAVVRTRFGDAASSEEALVAFLAWRRFDHQPPNSYGRPPPVARNANKLMAALRNGFADSGTSRSDLPEWAERGAPYPPRVERAIAEFRKEDTAEPTMHVAQEAVVFDGSDLEAALIKRLVGAADALCGIPDLALCCGLAARVESGTNCRSGNVRDIRWRDCQLGGCGVYGVINVINSKPLGNSLQSATGAARAQPKVARYINDVVTGLLFKEWFRRHLDKQYDEDQYFFPSFRRGDMDWSERLQPHHYNTAIQDLALLCGAARDEVHCKLFTSTSLRRGNAVHNYNVTRERGAQNKSCGWASASRVPLAHYTPDHVLLKPGPLFDDVAHINNRYERAVFDHSNAIFLVDLCTHCGFPRSGKFACKCPSCLKAAAGHHGQTTHSCWRAGRGMKVLDASIARLQQEAWAALGCHLRLSFDNRVFAFARPVVVPSALHAAVEAPPPSGDAASASA